VREDVGTYTSNGPAPLVTPDGSYQLTARRPGTIAVEVGEASPQIGGRDRGRDTEEQRALRAQGTGLHRARSPPIVESSLQQRAETALEANKHRASPERKGARKYLLSGLIRCEVCGYACTGRTSTGRVSGGTRKYSYYGCVSNRAERGTKGSASRILPPR
jgi:recombinase-like zinc beta ribbon protein